MAYEILKKIVFAEEEAEHIVENANAELEKTIKDAEKRAEELLALTYKNNKQIITQASEAACESVKAEIRQISAEAENDCISMRTKAEANREAAVNAVIGKVVGDYGRS